MKIFTGLILFLGSTACFGQPISATIQAPSNPIQDSYFETIQDMPSPSWDEFSKVMETAISCQDLSGRKPPLCEKATDLMFTMLWQGLHRVMAANVLARDKGFVNICDSYAEHLVVGREYGPQASYALTLVSTHMKAATPMYVGPLGQTPFYRVLYNAMVDEKPCKK